MGSLCWEQILGYFMRGASMILFICQLWIIHSIATELPTNGIFWSFIVLLHWQALDAKLTGSIHKAECIYPAAESCELWKPFDDKIQLGTAFCLVSKHLFSCRRIMESRSGWATDLMLIFSCSVSKLKHFIKPLFANNVRSIYNAVIAKMHCAVLFLYKIGGSFSLMFVFSKHSYLPHNSNKICQLYFHVI